MSALAAPPASTSETRRIRPAALLALVLLVLSARGLAQEPVAAVLKEQKVSFPYSSQNAIYACTALADRVASIFRALGARDDVQVTVNDCSESITPPPPTMTDTGGRSSWPSTSNNLLERRAGRRQSVHVKVRAMMPTEVTPDVIAWLKRDKSRRELVSRITGNPSPRFNDPIVFEAQWQPVTLSRKTIGVSPEECELLEQISGTAFRELGIRVINQGTRCDPDRPSRIPPELVVEAFMPVLDGADSPQQVPATEEGDQDQGAQ